LPIVIAPIVLHVTEWWSFLLLPAGALNMLITPAGWKPILWLANSAHIMVVVLLHVLATRSVRVQLGCVGHH